MKEALKVAGMVLVMAPLILLPEILILAGVIVPEQERKQKYEECVAELQDKKWCWEEYRD